MGIIGLWYETNIFYINIINYYIPYSNLQYSLELNSSLSHRNDCTLCIHQTLPSSLYVNSDELNELRRLNQVTKKKQYLNSLPYCYS